MLKLCKYKAACMWNYSKRKLIFNHKSRSINAKHNFLVVWSLCNASECRQESFFSTIATLTLHKVRASSPNRPRFLPCLGWSILPECSCLRRLPSMWMCHRLMDELSSNYYITMKICPSKRKKLTSPLSSREIYACTVTPKTEPMQGTWNFKWRCRKQEWSKSKAIKTKIVEYKVLHTTVMIKSWFQLQ